MSAFSRDCTSSQQMFFMCCWPNFNVISYWPRFLCKENVLNMNDKAFRSSYVRKQFVRCVLCCAPVVFFLRRSTPAIVNPCRRFFFLVKLSCCPVCSSSLNIMTKVDGVSVEVHCNGAIGWCHGRLTVSFIYAVGLTRVRRQIENKRLMSKEFFFATTPQHNLPLKTVFTSSSF